MTRWGPCHDLRRGSYSPPRGKPKNASRPPRYEMAKPRPSHLGSQRLTNGEGCPFVRQIHRGFWALLGAGLLIQWVPYGRNHANLGVVREPEWDRPRTRELFFRVCKNCHSYETERPWYSFVAPASWLVQRDVEEGRSHFNVSEWGREENHGDEAAELVREGEMPPWFYLPLHPEARLSDEERNELVVGLVATFGDEESDSRHDHANDHQH